MLELPNVRVWVVNLITLLVTELFIVLFSLLITRVTARICTDLHARNEKLSSVPEAIQTITQARYWIPHRLSSNMKLLSPSALFVLFLLFGNLLSFVVDTKAVQNTKRILIQLPGPSLQSNDTELQFRDTTEELELLYIDQMSSKCSNETGHILMSINGKHCSSSTRSMNYSSFQLHHGEYCIKLDKTVCDFTGMLDEDGEQASRYCGSDMFAPKLPWRGQGFVFPSPNSEASDDDSCVKSSRALESFSPARKLSMSPVVRRHYSGPSVTVLKGIKKLFDDGQSDKTYPILLKLDVTHWGLSYEVDCVSSNVLSCEDKAKFCDPSDFCIFRDMQHNVTWISPTGLGFDEDDPDTDSKRIEREDWLLKQKGEPLNIFIQLPVCPSIRIEEILPFMDIQLAEKLHLYLERVHRPCVPMFLSDVANTLLGKRLIEVLSGISIRAPTVSEEIEVADGEPSTIVTIVVWPLVLFGVAILINFLGLGILWMVTPTPDFSKSEVQP